MIKKSVLEKEEEEFLTERKLRKRQLWTFILLSLSNTQHMLFQNAINQYRKNTDGTTLWLEIVKHYERNTVSNTLHLIEGMDNIKFKNEEGIDIYISRIIDKALRFNRIIGKELDTNIVFYFIYKDLPRAYENIIDTIKSWDILDLEKAKGLLRSRYETLKREQNNGLTELADKKNGANSGHQQKTDPNGLSTESETVLYSKGKSKYNNRNKFCTGCRTNGHTATECKWNDTICFNCQEKGHPKSKCPKLSGQENSGRVHTTITSGYGTDDTETPASSDSDSD